MSDSPRIYVGTYKKYNEGNLFGEWVDLDDFAGDPDGFYAKCKEIHKDEPDPEFGHLRSVPGPHTHQCTE